MQQAKGNLDMNRIAIVAVLALSCVASRAAEMHKAENADALNLASSWVEGVVPGPEDKIVWREITATDNVDIGGDLSVLGLDFTSLGTAASLNVNDANNANLTIGAGGIAAKSGSNKTVLIYPAITLAADQTWSNGGGGLNFGKVISLANHKLTLNNVELRGSANVVGPGSLVVNGGTLKFSSGTAATDVTIDVLKNGIVQFNETPAAGGAARAAAVNLNGTDHYDGARIQSNGRKNEDAHDVVTGAMTAMAGYCGTTLSPNAAKHLTLEIGSLEIQDPAIVNFRGNQLGLTPMSDLVPNAATLKFVQAPTLVSGIVPGAIVSTNTSDYGYTFATYDATYGVRPLDLNADYVTAIESGTASDDIVRLVNGTDGTPVVTELAAGSTEIGALMLDTPNATQGAGGVVVTGPADAVLKVRSGTIYGRQMMSAVNAGDVIAITNVTLDLNGRAGKIISRQTQQSNMTSNAPLTLDCNITNDGGHGVTVGSVQNRGLVYLQGTVPSTYTGPTRVINGNVRILKSVANIGVPGDLEVYGGSCLNNGNQLPDTANVRVYGGSYLQKGGQSNSGSGASETFNDLHVAGGSVTFGADGTSSGRTDMHDAVMDGGTWRLCRGHNIYLHHLTLSGGSATFARWQAYNGYQSRAFVAAGVAITNTALSAYVPFTVESGTYDTKNLKFIPGNDFYLSGGLVFAGNDSNTNTVTIVSSRTEQADVGLCPLGLMRLDAQETFEIGDGAADVDLRIEAKLADDNIDKLAGGIVKTGAGTLMLANGSEASGTIEVNEGRLIADGVISNDVSVAAGAIFRGGDTGETGTLSVGGDIGFAAGAKLEVDPGAIAEVEGTVSFAGNEIVLKDGAAITEDVKVLTAESVVGGFVGNFGKYRAKLRNGGRELWLALDSPLLIYIR